MIFRPWRRDVLSVLGLYAIYLSGILFNLIALPLLANIFPTVEFSHYVVGVSIVGFVTLIHEYGFSLGSIRELGQTGSMFAAIRVVANVTISKLVLSTICILITAVAAIFYASVEICLCVGIGIAAGYKYRWYYQWRLDTIRPALVDVTGKALLLFVVAAGAIDSARGFFSFWLVLESAGTAVVSGRLIRLAFGRAPMRAVDGFSYLRGGVEYFLIRLLSSSYTILPTVLLKALHIQASEIAIYGIAERVARSMTALITPISDILYAKIVGSQDRQHKSSYFLLLVGGVFTLALAALAPQIALFFGAKYASSIPMIRYLSPLPFVVSLGTVLCIHRLVAQGRARIFAIVLFFAVIFFCITAPLLVADFSVYGMASAVVATELFVCGGALVAIIKGRSSHGRI